MRPKKHRFFSIEHAAHQSQAIGKPRGGVTTKILALSDALANLADFCLLPGKPMICAMCLNGLKVSRPITCWQTAPLMPIG